MKNKIKLLSIVMVICMLLSSCAQGALVVSDTISDSIKSDNATNGVISDSEITGAADQLASDKNVIAPKKGEYNEGVALVKYDGEIGEALLFEMGLKSASPIFDGSAWYLVELEEGIDTAEAIALLRESGCFDGVDYDYVMGATGPKEDAEKNPNYDDQVNLGLSNIPNGWLNNGKAPGGSPDVVVAVIDTGVDYNHIDLRNNIWTNPAEIPDNGKDDDGNGYVDDVYGWNFVGKNNTPMDDNGHGTHVAGIIAAENNKEGGVGVAYNCKVMVLKAGNSSGYFNNSDIAAAIQYAYMNGASVINMSFGGSNISIAVEEALENAYNTSVLVAAAGNDGACNNLACRTCGYVGVTYPAALPYVIGVMSVDKDGKHTSSFSNYDHYPYDSIEYEVYAVGEGVGSTWPSNKYACLNGTSMAAPTVSGIAALLRSYYSDREVYSTKFIQSQIVNTGTVYPHVSQLGDGHVADDAHSVADVLEAINNIPKPNVNLYGYHIDDSVSISENNNGNGVIDAGETVRLYIELHNRGGVATNVNVSIDTYRSTVGDEALTDPYFTFVNPTMQLSDIGTYSVRESGDKYFEIVVDEDCPNDYLVDFNIRFTYENGLDADDKTTYADDGKQKAQFNVSRGYLLPATITEDTIYTADRLYIVGQNVVIPEGVTVTFEAGCEIQFYDDREYYNSPIIVNYGILNMYGTKDNMININPSEEHAIFAYGIANYNTVIIDYTISTNFMFQNCSTTAYTHISNSYFYQVGRKYSATSFEICAYNKGAISGCAGNGTAYHLFHSESSPSYTASICFNNCFIQDTAEYSRAYKVRVEFYGCYLFLGSNTSRGINALSFNNNVFCTKKLGSGYAFTATLGEAENNYFLSVDNSASSLMSLKFSKTDQAINNSFCSIYQQYASQVIEGYYDSTGNPTVDVYGSLADASLLWPHVVSVEMFDNDGNPITRVGKEEIKVRVTFNRAMDTTQNTFLTFGTIEPYADYRIDGAWVSDAVWEGTYTLKAQIENGQNFLKVNNACAAEDPTKTVFGEYQLHEFTIDTTAAMAMNLLAFPQENGILLNFVQDDYDTLLGYNIYRATSKDGSYVKLNPAILTPDENSFLDENAEPGKTYWYTYTVVLTDFSESAPAGRVSATAMDTVAPNMYHTPVNQGYLNNNLVISCTASDNVAISSVTLYYRTVGSAEWRTLNMSKQSDKYSAAIFGSDLTLDGIEYYIIATDGINTIAKGSAERPYTVVIKDSSAISRLGDVDGDGIITTKDALMIIQSINGELLLSGDEFIRADLNKDGKLNSFEALRILQYINGKVNTLEM